MIAESSMITFIATYILVIMAVLAIICVIGYNKNYKGKSEESTKDDSQE